MYSRYPSYEPPEYMPRGHTHQPMREPRPEPPESAREKRGSRSPGFKGIGALLRNLKLDWDSGDILLILIILLLSAESDDTELIIILALVLLMGF